MGRLSPCVSRTTTAPAVDNVVPALLGQSEAAPAWLPAPAVDADQVVLLVLDGLGLGPAPGAPAPRPDAGGHGRAAPINTVAPTTTATRAHLDRHRPDARRARRRRLPHGRRRRAAQRPALGDAATATPASVDPARLDPGRRPVRRRSGRRWSPGPSSPQSGFTLAHLDRTRLHGVPHGRRRWSPRCAALLGAGEPFVYAYYDGIDKVAHEYGLARALRRRAARPPTAWSPTCVDGLPRRRGARGHRRPRPGRRGRRRHRPRPRRARATSPAVRRGPLPLAARPPGPGRRARSRRPRPHHGDAAWVREPRARSIDERWFGPKVTARPPARLGDVALVARGPWRSTTRPTPGPYHLIGRHGSLTAAEMLVPLLATAPERPDPTLPSARPSPDADAPDRCDRPTPSPVEPAELESAPPPTRPTATPSSTTSRWPSRPRSCGSAR